MKLFRRLRVHLVIRGVMGNDIPIIMIVNLYYCQLANVHDILVAILAYI